MRLLAVADLTDKPEDLVEVIPARPEVWRPNTDYVRRLFTSQDLDDLIVSGGLGASALTVANFSRRAVENTYTMRRHGTEPALADLCDPLSVAQYVQEGYSLHVSNLQRYNQRLLFFTDRLGFELGAVVKCDSFLTPPGAQAFAEHYDTNDNLICQVEGSKHWRLYRPSFSSPLKRHPWRWADASEKTRARILEGEPDMEVRLDPGAVLWIPRGWIHAGSAGESTSLHLTLRPESVSLEWISQQIIQSLADQDVVLRGSGRSRGFRTPKSTMNSTLEVVELLSRLLGECSLPDVNLDVWRAHCGLFSGPTLRPIGDLGLYPLRNDEELWFRPEGVCGYRRRDGELLLNLGSARKEISGRESDIVEGLLENGDHRILSELRSLLGDIVEWDRLSDELRAVGLAVSGDKIPEHWREAPRAISSSLPG